MATPLIKVDIDTALIERDWNALAQKQLPFAEARARTWTARDARDVVRAALPRTFTVRNTFVARSFQIDKALKSDWPLSPAVVGSINPRLHLDLHAEGGTKRSESGERVAIPVAARPRPRVRITPKVKRAGAGAMPAVFFADPRFFVRELPNGTALVFKRVGRKGRKLKLFYVLRPSVEIERTWDFEDQVATVVRLRYGPNFTRSLDNALKTAKRWK